jgi:dihydroneopterin aldolase
MTDPAPFRPASAAQSDAVRRRIFVTDLVVPCAIGVHAHERGGTQRVRINVEVRVADDNRQLHDSIANVVSYETIVDGIRAITARGHINLAETLADRIVDLCFADERAKWARVRVEKLDVYADAAGVGVEVERECGTY